LVLDDVMLEPSFTVQTQHLFERFLRDKMGVDDFATVALTSGTHSPSFTNDRDSLLKIIDGATGEFDAKAAIPFASILGKRVRLTIINVVRQLEAVPHQQKALIVVSARANCLLRRDGSHRIVDDGEPIPCRQIFEDAVRAGVSVYVLDPRRLTVPECTTAQTAADRCNGRNVSGASGLWRSLQSGVATVAEETGGFAVTQTNNVDRFLDRIVSENSHYYRIGYYSTNVVPDGKFRSNRVTVNRRGFRLTYRSGYIAPKADDR
jgi:VWFA-related protein